MLLRLSTLPLCCLLLTLCLLINNAASQDIIFPSCQPLRLDRPLRSNVTVPVTPGTAAQMFCDPGYDLRVGDPRYIFCTNDGTWSPSQKPSCQPLNAGECAVPVTPVNGSHNATSRPIPTGTVVEYKCRYPLELQGLASQVCQRDGKWSGQQPYCVVACEYPALGPHLQHNLTVHMFPVRPGTWVGYKCDFGFFGVGNLTRVCADNGSWTGTEPFCAASLSTGKNVSRVSGNVDVQLRKERRGMAIVDGMTVAPYCSVASAADRQDSFWQVDLLEKQDVHVIVLIFQFQIHVNVSFSYGQREMEEIEVYPSDYNVTQKIERVDSDTGSATTLEFRLRHAVKMRYLTVKIRRSLLSEIYLCSVFVLSKTAPSMIQCYSPVVQNKASLAIVNNTCYTFTRDDNSETWANSDRYCHVLNGSLAQHVDEDKQRLIASHLVYINGNANRYWIGGNTVTPSKDGKQQTSTTREWRWVDGTPFGNDKGSFWGLKQPSMSADSKACLAVSDDFNWQWDDRECDTRYNFICEHVVQNCGSPDVPTNTFLEWANDARQRESQVGNRVVYRCPAGYEMLLGDAERTCRGGGYWSGTAPHCFRASDPNHPDNQRYVHSGLTNSAIAAIVAGVIIGFIVILFIVLFIVKKKKSGSKMIKFTKETGSAETLDVESDKKSKSGGKGKTNYAATQDVNE